MAENLDLACRKILMSAYLYYRRGVSVISDAENDRLCTLVSSQWSSVPKHYQHLLDPNSGGAEAILHTTMHCKYTDRVEKGALAWLQEIIGEELAPLSVEDALEMNDKRLAPLLARVDEVFTEAHWRSWDTDYHLIVSTQIGDYYNPSSEGSAILHCDYTPRTSTYRVSIIFNTGRMLIPTVHLYTGMDKLVAMEIYNNTSKLSPSEVKDLMDNNK